MGWLHAEVVSDTAGSWRPGYYIQRGTRYPQVMSSSLIQSQALFQIPHYLVMKNIEIYIWVQEFKAYVYQYQLWVLKWPPFCLFFLNILFAPQLSHITSSCRLFPYCQLRLIRQKYRQTSPTKIIELDRLCLKHIPTIRFLGLILRTL